MKYLRYLWYVLRHKWYVFLECKKEGLWLRGLLHDVNKFTPKQLIPYAEHFYGGRTKEKEFGEAWLHHQNSNKHHWQYWVRIDDSGVLVPLEMPVTYVVEMLCDWKGANKAQKGEGVVQWYLQNREYIILHPSTRKFIEELLGLG